MLLAPLPFGAVGPVGRGAFEAGCFALLLIWGARGLWHSTPLPSRWALWGLAGLLFLAVLQCLPIGSGPLGFLSPGAARLRATTAIEGSARAAENALLGTDAGALDGPPALSVDRHATASALRTGAALAGLFLVAAGVAATRGLRRVLAALVVSAGFQGLYGVLVVATGSSRIWNEPKLHYLDCATGTFANRNHFAGFLALGLAAGLGLILAELGRTPARAHPRRRRLDFWGAAGSRTLLLGLAWLLALAGLLASFSRAGTALAVAATAATALAAGRRGLGVRTVALLAAGAIAVLPLAQLGAQRLVERYGNAAESFQSAGGRATVWSDTLGMATEFPLTGAGFGTFGAAYPAFRSPEVRLYYSHAHNDLLEAAAEGGILGLLFLGCLVGAAVRLAVRAVAGALGPLAIGVGAALAAALLHGLIDFNFHIPANAATAAILAGALEGVACTARG